ncbi:tetratricopeptide repeat-containing sensor histidine kinase [Spirosoma linguale]|uniref:histidine kinase n=1 Tax=Spirosoma linguale (strain ATCC 33905 / DSM 74 / LMG 10896 / Claus 1) TaxID=504472 RepID=D2QBY2_SPILD|nr:histidine kinase [Spirosoma linguale DSM 74]
MPRLLLVFLLLLAYSPAFAQPKAGQARLDSLLAELPRTKPDTNRVNLLKDICIAYYGYGNNISNESISYANQALTLARQLMWKKGMAVAYKILGNIYAVKSDNPPALTAYLSGLKIAEEIKDKSQIASITGNIGYVYSNLANYPQALAYYKKALKGHEELGNKSGVVLWLSLIGEVYSEQGKYSKALDYQLKSFKLKGVKSPYAYHLDNVGQAYLNLGDYPQALTYLQNGLKLSKANSNKQTLVRSYNNLGKLYLKIAIDSNATLLTTLLRSSKTNTLQKAKTYADSAVVLAKERGDLTALYRAYQTRSQIQDALGEPQAAFASFKNFITTKERVINQQNTNSIAVATLQYDFDKKETALRYEQQLTTIQLQQQKQQRTYLLGGVGLLLALLGLTVYSYTQKQKANTVLQQQKEEINTQRTKAENALTELRDTQIQLIQKEKMASLGELTAGIAHEIQNPLNFVNNFSDVSTELVDELKDGPFHKLPDSDKEYAAEILGDLTQNLQKITLHGGRASAIVRGMLEHSRSSTGEREPTDLNALVNEYLRLAYQGQRTKDKTFTCELVNNLDAHLSKVELVAAEMGRVLLNLINNAFYAVREKQKTAPLDYKPQVTIHTCQVNRHIQIGVGDNGTGIAESVKAKIFQPFFTTKPTGEGTGLGLSLSYDIVTKGHGGSLTVESREGEGTTFVIQLPALS